VSVSPAVSDHDAEAAARHARPQPHPHDHVVDAPPARVGATGAKGALLPALIVLAIGAIFVSVYLAAFHAPKPHQLPVAVVGATTEQFPGFELRSYPDLASARSAVQHREVYAAYDASGPAGSPVLLYSSANGPSVTALLEGTFLHGKVSAAQDVQPASSGDTRGLSVFYSAFGLVLAGFLFGTMTYQMAPRLEFRWRMAGLAFFSAAGGLAVAAIAGAVFGALPGPFLAIAGLTALMAAAVGGATMALVRLLGPAGVSVSSVLLLILGNATSGGILPPDFLPAWLHPLSSVLPVGVGVRAIQGVAYFHNDGVIRGIVVLVLWIAACAGILWQRDVRAARERAA
jgi:hypothetical protein